MLVVQTRLGWQWPLWILATGLLSGALLMALFYQVAGRSAPDPQAMRVTQRVSVRDWISYFSVPEHRVWLPLLLFYFPVIGAVWVYMKPLLLDQGFPMEQVAWIAGVASGLVAAAGSMLGGYVSRRWSIAVALPASTLLGLLGVCGLAMAIAQSAPQTVFVGLTMCIAVSMGACATQIFGLTMYHTRAGRAALDYGIQTSLFSLMRTIVPMLIGLCLDRMGYLGMLLTLAAALMCVLVLARRYVQRRQRHWPKGVTA